ncbi:MAG: BtrH N-terminal domain-containing protein [Haloglomus sp.]
MRIDGFEHAPGAHCGSTSLRDLADYYDWGLSEPACFGLGSGLGFAFLELSVSPWRLFIGRPLWLESAFFENLAVRHTERRGDDWGRAWTDVKRHVDAGDPVLVFVDLYYLDYYDTDTHFAPHSLLVTGYDETADATDAPHADPDAGTGVAYMADSEFEEIKPLPLSSLRAAWAATDMLPLDNRYIVAEGDPRAAAGEAARDAVVETARYMLDPADATRETLGDRLGLGTHGLPGMRAFADSMAEWPDLEDPSWVARFAYQNVERRGTGGGAFRGLYAPFLDELGAEAGLDDAFAAEMHGIAEDWSSLAAVLYEASETEGDEMASLLDDAAARVHAVADREERFYEDMLAELS